MELPVLARAEHYVVVAKPAGLMVHRNQHTSDRVFALQVVRDQVGCYVHAVHRLDRATSGCLLFALNGEWARLLQEAITSPDAVKTYLAFVRGEFRHSGPVEVDNPMKDSRGHRRDARSVVSCLGTSAHPRCSLLQVRPATGRFHQVRRHVRDLSHPVLGDSQHGDTRVNRAWREEWGLNRLGLHCLSLDLPLPGGERLQASCPVPDDLARVLRRMPWWDQAVEACPQLALRSEVPE